MGEPRADHGQFEEEDEVGEEIIEEFRTLFVPRRDSMPRRAKTLSVSTEKARLLESCLDDLDKDKDDMLQAVKLELARAVHHAQESEQRSGEYYRQAENFRHDVHTLVEVLSVAFHSGQWKFASAEFRTVSDGMLPPAGATSKEATRATWLEKQLAERGRQIQSLQQELVSGSARHRVLQEQVTKRDSDLADLRQAQANSQERAAAIQEELERSEREAGERHSVLMAEVKQRDALVESLQAENAKLQRQCDTTAKSSLANADQASSYQQDISNLTQSLQSEKAHSSKLADDLTASKETAENLTQQLASQEARVDSLLQRLNLQISDLQSNVSVVEAQYKTACVETEAAQAELSNCTQCLQNAQADATLYHEQLLDSRAKVEQWEASVQLMRTEHAAEIASRDDLADSLRQQLAKESQRSSSQVNEKAESMSSLSTQAQQLQAEKLALQEKYEKDRQELGVVQVEAETSREENKLCHRRIVQLEEDQNTLRTELAEQRGELDLKEKQISVLRDSHQTLMTTIDVHKDRLSSLDNLECTKVTLEQEVSRLQSELETLKGNLESKETSLEQVNVTLGELEAERARLADMVQARDREVSRLTQNQVADISQGEKIETLELQLLEVKDDLTAANTNLRKSQAEAAEWKTTCEANESTVNRFKAECDRIRNLLVLKTEEIQAAKDQTAEVEREQRRLVQEVQTEKNRALQLQAEVNSLCHHQADTTDSLRREVESIKCNASYMTTADRLTSELDEVNREVIQLRRSLASAEEEQDKLTAQLRASQDTCSRLESKCEAAELSAQQAREAADRSSLSAPSGEEIELRQVKQTNDFLTAELTQRQNVVDVLRRDVDELKGLNRTATREMKLKQLRLRQLEQDVEAQRLQNTTLKEKIASHERCQAMLESALERAQGDRDGRMDKTDGSMSMQNGVNSLRHHRDEVEESLRRELESLKCGANYMATADRLSNELDEVNREVIQLRRSLATSEEEHDKLTAKYRAAQDTCSRLESKCEAAELSAQQAREAADRSSISAPSGEEIELRQVKQTNEFLTAELTQRQNAIDVLRHDVDELKGLNRTTTHELKLKQLRTRQLEQDIEAQNIQNTTLKEKIMAHERRQTLLEVALERSQEERSSLSDKIDSFVALTSQQQGGSAALTLKAKSLDQQVSELKTELDNCNGTTEVLEREIEILRSEQDVAGGAHKQLVSQLQTTVSTLGQQLDKVVLQRSDDGDDDEPDGFGASDEEDEVDC